MPDILCRRGDTVDITLNFAVDGQTVTEGMLDEIQYTLGEKDYLLSRGEVYWDDNSGMYHVFIPQADTFALKLTTIQQIRIRMGTTVGSTDQLEVEIGDTKTRRVI